jgi:hypothetical protein
VWFATTVLVISTDFCSIINAILVLFLHDKTFNTLLHFTGVRKNSWNEDKTIFPSCSFILLDFLFERLDLIEVNEDEGWNGNDCFF